MFYVSVIVILAMSKFYFIRHAKSKAPEEITKGHTEWPLADDTTRLDKLANWFADTELDNPLIASSDLNRAKETAKRINEEVDTSHKVSDALREMDFGEITGLSLEEYTENNPEYKVRKYRELAYNKKLPNGESPKETSNRTLGAIEELKSHDGDVVVVTHTTPLFTILADVYDQPQYNTDYDIQYCELFITDKEVSEIIANVRFPTQMDIITPV